jgi:5-dehydro-2-deoxygluconokinase
MSVVAEARAPEFDLISMGRAILDVYGEQVGCAMEEVSSFAKYVGGCPANIAIGASRLGLKVAMITRVGDDQHGRFIREQLRREGVDVSHVKTDPDRATGVAFLAIRDKETFPLLHYRDDCADMAIAPDDYSAEFIGRARALLVSGSHLTTPRAMANIGAAIEHARAKRTRVIFDIDYRPLFWGLAQRDFGESRFVASDTVTEASQRFLPFCDLVVGTERRSGSPGTRRPDRGAQAHSASGRARRSF